MDRVLYVSRAKAASRQVANEAQLLDVIREVWPTCEVIFAEDLSFMEQLELYRSARIVIGPHGAGFTNLLFCQPGATIVEILPRNSPGEFYRLTGLRGLKYVPYVIDADVHFAKSFEVDPTQFKSAIEKL